MGLNHWSGMRWMMKKIIEAIARNKLNNYSYSKIHTYDDCHYRFKLKYIDKLKIEKLPIRALERGKYIHKLIESYFLLRTSGIPFDIETLKTMSIEDYPSNFSDEADGCISTFFSLINSDRFLSLFPENINVYPEVEMKIPDIVVAYIDAYVEIPGDNTVILYDWKTGKTSKYNGRQLAFYYLLLNYLRPEVKSVIIRYYLVEQDELVEYQLDETNEIVSETRDWIISTLEEIDRDTIYTKNMNNCKFCEYKEYCQGETSDILRRYHDKYQKGGKNE